MRTLVCDHDFAGENWPGPGQESEDCTEPYRKQGKHING